MCVCVCGCVCRSTKAVCFSCDGLRVFSGSDDTMLRCWDLSTQTCTLTLSGHQVRNCCHSEEVQSMYPVGISTTFGRGLVQD